MPESDPGVRNLRSLEFESGTREDLALGFNVLHCVGENEGCSFQARAVMQALLA